MVGRGGSGVAVTGRVGGLVGGDARDHGARTGHAGDGHVIGGARTGDGAAGAAGGAGEGHIAGGETGDRLAEHDGEVDGAGVGGIGLAARPG